MKSGKNFLQNYVSWKNLNFDLERKEVLEKPCDVEITPFTSELFDKLPENYRAWHLQNYGSKEAFLEKAFGFYAVENGAVCCESEAAF